MWTEKRKSREVLNVRARAGKEERSWWLTSELD